MYNLRVYFTVCPHLFMDKAKQQRTKPPQLRQLSYISFLHQTTTYILQSINLQ